MDEAGFAERFQRTYRRGEMVYEEGSLGQHMYVVAEGAVDIVRRRGGTEERLATIRKGDLFGETALLEHIPRAATAVAAEDSRLLEVDHALFVYLVTQQPAFALIVQKSMSLHLRGIVAHLAGEVLPAGPAPEAPAAPGEGKVPEPVALAEGVHLLRGRCNCYLVRGERKTLLVDTGLPWERGILEAQLASLGLAPADVDMVALTHEHMDHIGGVPLFPRRTVVAAHTLAANKIDVQDDFVLMSKTFPLDPADYHVDVHLREGTSLDLGGISLHVIHAPGHSSGSICLFEPDRRILLTGDTIFGGGILGGIFPSGNLSDYMLTLRRLSVLNARAFWPGHGRGSENPAEDFGRALHASATLMSDTRALFGVFDSRDDFADLSKGVSTYSRRV